MSTPLWKAPKSRTSTVTAGSLLAAGARAEGGQMKKAKAPPEPLSLRSAAHGGALHELDK